MTLSAVLAKFQNPGVIFFWPYVLSAGLLTLAYLKMVGRARLAEAWRLMFARRVWWTRSTGIDVLLSAIYALLLSVPATAFQLLVFSGVARWLDAEILSPHPLSLAFHWPAPVEALLVTVVIMLCVDLATYVMHRLLHALPVLWPIHAVHHSAEHLTLFTTHRQHPIEPFLLNGLRGTFAAVGIVIFYALFPQRSPPWTIMGMGAGFFLYMFTVNLQHSPIPVRYPSWLRGILMSPHAHHMHHSRDVRHYGKNYGVIFSLWDRVFGTYAEEDLAPGDLVFGLGPGEDPFRQSVLRLYAYPLYAPLLPLLAKVKCRCRGKETIPSLEPVSSPTLPVEIPLRVRFKSQCWRSLIKKADKT